MSEFKKSSLVKGTAVLVAAASLTTLAITTATTNHFANAETGNAADGNNQGNDQGAVTTKNVNFADALYGAVAHAFAGTDKAVDATPLTDGNAKTAFKPGAANYSFEFDFGQARTFTKASVAFRHGSAGTVYVSDDGQSWNPVLNFKAATQTWNVSEGAISGHRFVKFVVDSTANASADASNVEVENVTFDGSITIPSDYDVATQETKKDETTGKDVLVKGDVRQNLKFTEKDGGYEGYGVSEDGKSDLHVGESKDFYFKATDGDTSSKFTVTSTDPDTVEVSQPELVTDANSPLNGYYKVTITAKAPTGSADGELGGTPVVITSNLDANAYKKVVLVRAYYYAEGVNLSFGNGVAPDNGYVLPVNDKALAPTALAYATVDGKVTTNGVLQRLFWKSDNESVVKVENGNSTLTAGNKAGRASITINSNDVKDENTKAENKVAVKVVNSSAEKVEITTPEDYDAAKGVEAGKTVQLAAKVTPEDASQTVTWKSSDEKVATVDENGLVTGVAEGTVTIQALSKTEGVVAQVELKVTAPAPTKVTVAGPEGVDLNNVKAGETVKLTAAVEPAAAHQDVVWRSSDETIATVAEDGTVTTLKDGKVTITAVAKDTVKTETTDEDGVKATKDVKADDTTADTDSKNDAADTNTDNKDDSTTADPLEGFTDAEKASLKDAKKTGFLTVDNPTIKFNADTLNYGNVDLEEAATFGNSDPDLFSGAEDPTGWFDAEGKELSYDQRADATYYKYTLKGKESGKTVTYTFYKGDVPATTDPDQPTDKPENTEVSGSVDITVVPAQDPEEYFAGLTATYADKDGKETAVEGWDASKDGSYTLPEGTDLSTLALKDKDGKAADAIVTYTKDGKDAEAKDADTAVYSVTSGDATRTFTFTTTKAAVKTWKVTVKNNNGAPDTVVEVADGASITDYTDPIWTGHTFAGYYTTADFKAGTEFDFKTTPITSDLTIYVKWTEDGKDDNNNTDETTKQPTADELKELAKVQADYIGSDGTRKPVEGFDGTKDGSYVIDGGIETLAVHGFPESWNDKASITYTANGKVTDVSTDADAATVVLTTPSGAKVTYAFTEKAGADNTDDNTNDNKNDDTANAQTNNKTNTNGTNGTNNTGSNNSSTTPAKTGAAAGIIGVVASLLIGAGVSIKRFMH